MEIKQVVINICEDCLEGKGDECHTPGCAMFMHTVDLAIHPDMYEVVENLEKVENLENRLFELGEMKNAPCFVCGYNGPGYFQPDKHPCADRHHKLCKPGLTKC